jgi:hypothetical protein
MKWVIVLPAVNLWLLGDELGMSFPKDDKMMTNQITLPN